MAPLVEWDVAARSIDGESGDQYFVREAVDSVLVAVADGLGHGPAAAAAARTALAALGEGGPADLGALVTRCHESLRGTRGAVLSVAAFAVGSVTWLGVGNVDGVLVRAGSRIAEPLLVRSGVLGGQLPSLEVTRCAVARGDTLIVSTDGIDARFAETRAATLDAPANAKRILVDYGKATDDALVMVVRYVGPEAVA